MSSTFSWRKLDRLIVVKHVIKKKFSLFKRTRKFIVKYYEIYFYKPILVFFKKKLRTKKGIRPFDIILGSYDIVKI